MLDGTFYAHSCAGVRETAVSDEVLGSGEINGQRLQANGIDGVGADRVVAVNLPAARCERRGRDEGDSGWSLANADGTRLSSLKVLLCDVGEGWTAQRLGGCTPDS